MASSWDESLETGNAVIDIWHRQLISLLKDLKDELIHFQPFAENFLKDHEFGLDRQLADWAREQNETSRAA